MAAARSGPSFTQLVWRFGISSPKNNRARGYNCSTRPAPASANASGLTPASRANWPPRRLRYGTKAKGTNSVNPPVRRWRERMRSR